MKAPSPFLTVEEARDFLRFKTTGAFHSWRWRHARKLKTYRRGNTLLFKQSDLEAALMWTPATRGLRRVG